jgi:cell division protein FtsA
LSSKTTFIGAVEIGTAKITALVGAYTGREIVIIGCGECASRGVIKGSVVDYRAATECTHNALEMAERDANERINHVFLAQTGGHLEGFYNEASLNVKAADNMIEKDDIRTVCELAKAKDLPLGPQHPPPFPGRRQAGPHFAREPGRPEARGRVLDGARPGAAPGRQHPRDPRI